MKENKINWMKIASVVLLIFIVAVVAMTLTGCTEASKVNHNMSIQASQFGCERKITVYNALTDTIILEQEGYMDISNNETNELVVTCKVGADVYKKNYIYLNSFVLYTVEDITGTHQDPYHYKLLFHVKQPFDIEVVP